MMRTLLASEVAVKRLVITGVSGLALLVAAGCSSSKPQDAGLMGPRQVVPPPYKDPASVAANTASATEPVVVVEEPAGAVKGKGKEEGTKAFSLPPKVESKIDSYTVKSGDSFSKIGAKYGVSAAELAAFNKLSEKKAIKVGQTLRIPPGGTVSHKAAAKSRHVASATATHKKGEGKHETKKKKAEAKVGGKASAAVGEGKYSVKKGDSVDGIAKKHHVKAADLRAANDLKSDKLQIGQTLVIPGKKGETAVAVADGAAAVPATPEAPAPDTAAVAPVAVPTGTDAAAAAVAPVAAPTGTDAAAAPAPAPAANTLDHTVLTGETLESIAEMYSTTADAIIKLNPAVKGNADLKPNMTIQIPLSK